MPELPHEKLKAMAAASADLTSDARESSEKCRDYYDGHQWTAEQVNTLQKRKQPVITANRVQRKVDAMVGIEQRSRVDPRAMARNPQDEQAADIATKALVFVDDRTRFDTKRSAAFENMLIEGYGGAQIVVEPDERGQMQVVVQRLRWEEIFFDPHSREKDFSDATFIGIQKWMNLDQAIDAHAQTWIERQPEGTDPDQAIAALEEMLEASMGNLTGETYDDRPQNEQSFNWGDKRQRRVRVAEMYYQRGGIWYLSVFTGGGVIVNEPSPYMGLDGKPGCPIELMTAYIDRENRRYGLVKSMLSIQDEVNARRSKLMHQLNSRQTWGPKGAVDVEELKRELAKPDGHVQVDMAMYEQGVQPFNILQNQDQIAGQFNLLTEAKNEIDMLGPNASLLGQLGGDQSGRAIMAQQQAGLVELAPIYDSLRDWTLRCYRQMWMRIRQFWTDERWVRVTDEMQAPQFIAVNRVVGMQPALDPQTGQIVMQPVTENGLAEVDVDIIIDEAPDYVTLRQEQFEQLSQMAQAGIPIPPEMLIEASNLRDKRRVMETMQQAQQAAAQAQQQAQAAEMQIEQAKVSADVQRKQAAAAKDMASIPKVQAEAASEQADTAGKVMALRRAAIGL